jgi:hypothetical protein
MSSILACAREIVGPSHRPATKVWRPGGLVATTKMMIAIGFINRPARPAAASTSHCGCKLLDEFWADSGGWDQAVRALKMAKSAPGGAVFGAVWLDRVSKLRERDLGSAHQMRSAVDGLVAQESADLVGPERGGTSFAVGRRRLVLLVLRGRGD